MLETIILSVNILFIQEMNTSEKETLIRFNGNIEGHLLKDDTDYDRKYAILETNYKKHNPVGIRLSNTNTILTVMTAEKVTVVTIYDDDKYTNIYVSTHQGQFSINKSDPNYSQIKDVLEKSKTDKKPIWWIWAPMKIVAAIPVTEEQNKEKPPIKEGEPKKEKSGK